MRSLSNIFCITKTSIAKHRQVCQLHFRNLIRYTSLHDIRCLVIKCYNKPIPPIQVLKEHDTWINSLLVISKDKTFIILNIPSTIITSTYSSLRHVFIFCLYTNSDTLDLVYWMTFSSFYCHGNMLEEPNSARVM